MISGRYNVIVFNCELRCRIIFVALNDTPQHPSWCACVIRILISRTRSNHRDSDLSVIYELPQDDKYPCESWKTVSVWLLFASRHKTQPFYVICADVIKSYASFDSPSTMQFSTGLMKKEITVKDTNRLLTSHSFSSDRWYIYLILNLKKFQRIN